MTTTAFPFLVRFAPTRLQAAYPFFNPSESIIASQIYHRQALFCLPKGRNILADCSHRSLKSPARHVKRTYVWPDTQTRAKQTLSRIGSNQESLTNVSSSQRTPHFSNDFVYKKSTSKLTSKVLATQVPPKPDPSPSWVELTNHALRNGWTAVCKAKWLMAGFTIVLTSVYLAFSIEISLGMQGALHNKGFLFGLRAWLAEQPRALHPNSDHWDLTGVLIMFNLCSYREADWLRSPIFLIPHITSHFSHVSAWDLMSSLGLLMITLPYLRMGLSSWKIVTSFILGGFLSSNLKCAIERFTNPIARLTSLELEVKLNEATQKQPNERGLPWVHQFFKDWEEVDGKQDKLQRLALERTEKEQHADLQDIEAESEKLNQQQRLIEEKAAIAKYVYPILGSTHSIACLCTHQQDWSWRRCKTLISVCSHDCLFC